MLLAPAAVAQAVTPAPAAAPAADREPVQVRQGAAVLPAERHDLSPPLWLIPPAARQPRVEHEVKRLPRPGMVAPPQTEADEDAEPVAPLGPLTRRPESIPVIADFAGVGNGFSGPAGSFSVSSAPPDTNGDVGPNHYVQTVNTDFAVFNKVGTPLYGPVPINTLWSGFGGGCQSANDGDPIVLYDPIADRWFVLQFQVTTQPFGQCVAVSQTPDPTGPYYRYSFTTPDGFPDYPKAGVWPDAYYVAANLFNNAGTAYLDSKVCAYDRTKMLAGAAATQQCFDTSSAYGGLLPADLDGRRLPPPGSPNYLLGLGTTSTTLAFWKFHVDWTTPANSTFTGPTTLTVPTYQEACGFSGTCIPQLQGGSLDSLSDRLMNRFAYRAFADHESLVTNHSVTVGTSVGVRWYEIRTPNTTPTVYQVGTYAPDTSYRWMASAALDTQGNIGLGYSVSSSAIHPEIRFTARYAADPAGSMTQGDNLIIGGPGSQGSSLTRWGDYSSMSVDPVDDCTFWYTTMFIPANGTFNWKTQVGSFKLPGCCLDADGDGHGTASCGGDDCNDGDDGAFHAPFEIAGLTAAGKPSTTVSWSGQAAAAGPGTLYDLVSGPLTNGGGGPNFAAASCLSASAATLYTDARPAPASGTAYWYLVRGANSCAVGTYGSSRADSNIPVCH